MPKTLLAVDDSATMRKVLEFTFAGEDLRVVTAENAAGALARLSEDPSVVVIDTSLGHDDPYALAKEFRSRNARLAVVMLASRFTTYDANRGRDAGVDDFIDKPFDTQAIIDKVNKAITARETARTLSPLGGSVNIPPAAASPPRVPGAPPAPPGMSGRAWPTQRTHTLAFDGAPPPPAGATASSPLSRTTPSMGAAPPPPAPTSVTTAFPPAPALAAPAAPRPAPVEAARGVEGAAAVAGQVAATNGHLAGQLDDLGLTPDQVRAVLSLSRELVERVVWEVVPQMAEAIIKEEIARLTKEA